MINVIRFVVLGAFAASAAAQDPSVTTEKITDDEAEVVKLCTEMYEAFAAFNLAANAIQDADEQATYYQQHDPSAAFVQKLIDFEQAHRGTPAGLMAARRLVLLAAGGGLVNSPRDLGRREALRDLVAYADNEILPEILRYLNSGNPDVTSETCLRDIIARTSVEQNRLYAQYMLARWILSMRDFRTHVEQRLADIAAGAELEYPIEQDHLTNTLAAGVPQNRILMLEAEALRLLSQVADSNSPARQPAVRAVDKSGHTLRLDAAQTDSMPLVSEVARGLLFQQQHLRVGRPAPDLQVQLINDTHWSVSENRGKVLIIQFSYKGCGPCEAMYPDLSVLAEDYGDKLSILSVMADPEPAVTAEAVATGKITWNAAWDGFRGPIASLWAVESFPTVYVIGPDGNVAGVDLRGDNLRNKIQQLAK